MRTNCYKSTILACMGIGMLLLAGPVSAAVTGQCAICHTMHNSQGGAPMAIDANGNPQTAPNDVLLVRGCVACHTGANDGLNVIPYVNNTVPPNYGADGTTGDTLAGGNFYWVGTGGLEATGHNVGTDGLAAADVALGNTPPGSLAALTSQLTCAGAMGCHGDRSIDSNFGAISGTHHANDTIIDGLSVGTSYRFLLGVLGNEDSDWEYQPTATAHNQYQGNDRTSDTVDVTTTISSLCAQCHNDFHNGAGNVQGTSGGFGNPWVRHPTDFDMDNTAVGSEYRDYGGTGVNAYVVSAPVASADTSTVLANVFQGTDDAIVTCISCHRAHGTPNADLLRWDYTAVVAGAGGSGACFECHTTKM